MLFVSAILLFVAGIFAFSNISFAISNAGAFSGDGGFFFVGNNSTLNISSGSLSGASATNGGAVYVAPGGTFNLENGTIQNNTATANGGGVFVDGTFNMSGGEIFKNSAKNGNQIYNSGTFTMTGGTVGGLKAGDNISFGSYPQTKKSDGVSVDESGADENGYFLGSDGKKYAKLGADYYKVEPILWQVISVAGDNALLIPLKIVEVHRFDESSNDYAQSEIRTWLNSDFYNATFSAKEKDIIQETNIEVGTTLLSDNVSLVNKNNLSGFVGFNYNKTGTEYSVDNGLFVSPSGNGQWWILNNTDRNFLALDPGSIGFSGSVVIVESGGTIGITSANSDSVGVVPMITVSVAKAYASSGNGIYNTGTMNLYGGNVYDSVYSSSTINTKMSATISGTISLGETGTIVVQDYAGITPKYSISVSASRGAGTLITFVGSDTEPDISALNVSGVDTDCFRLKTQKDDNGNWTVVLYSYAMYFPSNWKTEVASNDYMSSTVTSSNLTSIKFVSSVPTGYTKIGTLSTGLPVYQGATATDIAFVAEKIYAPENCGQLFYNLTKLTSIEFDAFDTSKVTNMYQMFGYCTSLTSLDLGNFDTSKVTNMSNMFYNCTSLTSLDVSNFNTSKVTSMYYMFCYCSGLTSLDVSNFDTTNVTSMNSMFYYCSSLTSLNLSNFDTSNVTNMNQMFRYCSSLTSLDLSNFDTSKVTDMSEMFYSCSKLTSLDVSNFDTSKVTDMNSMFSICSGLTSLDVSNFNTSSVTKMNTMFMGCKGLTSLDVSNFNTTNVKYMSIMFSGCKGLTSLDVSNFNTSNVTNMSNMFSNCSGLTSLDVSNFDTSKVTYMGYMFSYCSSLTSLDLSTFNTKSLTSLKSGGSSGVDGETFWHGIFDGSNNLEYVDLSNWSNDNLTSFNGIFSGMKNLKRINLTNFKTPKAVEMNYMFYGCESLTEIDLSSFDTSKATNFNAMFYNCTNLTSLNLSNFDTSKVTRMVSMFYNCKNLTSLNLRNFNTANATRMQEMFSSCSSLTSLDLSSFNTSNVTSMSQMFYNCSSLTGLDLSSFNTSNVTSMSQMFYNCACLTSLDLSSFDTPKVTSMSRMFYSCSSLTNLNLSNFDTSKVTNMESMFSFCSSLTSLDLSNFNTTNVTYMYSMFYSCTSLTSLNLSNFDTTNVTYISSMFYGCSALETIDLSSFNMSKVSGFSDMLNFGLNNKIKVLKTPYGNLSAISINTGSTLYNAETGEVVTSVPANTTRSLTYVNVNPKPTLPSTWKTDVASNDYMSSTVTPANLTSIKFVASVPTGYTKIGNLSTGLPVYQGATATDIAFVAEKIYAPEDSKNLFYKLTKLTSIEFDVFDTSKVTNMSQMFYHCYGLTSLVVSGFDTSKVTDMNGMFCFCSHLTSLDLSNFNTSSVTNMDVMFYSCLNLTSLDLSNFNTTNVTSMDSMFQGCSKLTSLDLSNFDTSNVTHMGNMFYNCTSLISLDVNNFNTSKVIYMDHMFYNCTSLTNLDLSSFDISSVISTRFMFASCTSLASLDLSSFDMSKVSLFDVMLDFGSSNKIKVLKSPYKNTSALPISTGSSLYATANGTQYTSVPASLTSSITLRVAQTVSFDYNGGSGNESSRTVLYGLAIGTLPSGTQSGYTLDGWYTSASGGTKISSAKIITENSTFYAQWSSSGTGGGGTGGGGGTVDPDPDPPTEPAIEYAEYIIFTTETGVPSGLSLNNDFDWSSRPFFGGASVDVYTNSTGTRVAFAGDFGGLVAPEDCSYLFAEMQNLKWVVFRNFDTFNTISFEGMFKDCPNLEYVDFLSFQTPNVTSMKEMFANCGQLKQIASADFDCISLENASYMFAECTSLGKSAIFSGYDNRGQIIDCVPFLKYTYNLTDASYMFAGCGWENFSMSYMFTDNLSSVTGMFERSNFKVLNLSQFACISFVAQDIFGDGVETEPEMILTPRNCNMSSFFSMFSSTYRLGGGKDTGAFEEAGYVDNIPFSVCAVRNDKADSYLSAEFQVVSEPGDWDFSDGVLKSLIEMCSGQNIIFSGSYYDFTFNSYMPSSRDIYYLLPNLFTSFTNTSANTNDGFEGNFAGWIHSANDKNKEDLIYTDFIDRWGLDGGGSYKIVGWLDENMTCSTFSVGSMETSSCSTPYNCWFNNSRKLLSRVRYLPSVHYSSGLMFCGWLSVADEISVSYYTNITNEPDETVLSPFWWTDGLKPNYFSLEDSILYDYFELPVETTSFASNGKKTNEIGFEEFNKLCQMNNQEVIVPEDRKVTITELKLKKVS